MGIDPGLINTGFGIISFNDNIPETLDYGVISPDKNDGLSIRLNTIYNDIASLIERDGVEFIETNF